MFKYFIKLQWIFVFFTIFICGCASSERFSRISGGVISEYSAPDSIRLRSKKFQQKSNALSGNRKINNTKVAGVNDTIINIWPFFFASNNYWCALWPMIDSDDYGFAVRPFFNKEGDDCSILFPLSAWNNADKSGWIALFSWNKHGFGFVPFTWQSRTKDKSLYYYTPLFISSRDRSAFSLRNPFIHKRTDAFTFCALAYGSEESEVLTGNSPHGWILNHYKVNDAFRNEWMYRYRNNKAPFDMPGDDHQLLILQKLIFASAKIGKTATHGFFPLWHFSSDDRNQYSFKLALLLADGKKEKQKSQLDILAGLLFRSSHQSYPLPFSSRIKASYLKEENTWFSLPLLSGRNTKTKYRNNSASRFALFEKLKPEKYDEPFNAAIPRLNKQLALIKKGLSIPACVKDWNTFYLFRHELAEQEVFETEVHNKTITPLFFHSSSPAGTSFFAPLLLTGRTASKSSSRFISVPLFTFTFSCPDENYTAILPPVIYLQTGKSKKRTDNKIYPSDCKWGGNNNTVEENNTYSLFGLFYHGKHAFTVAKNGFDGKTAESIRWNTLEIARINEAAAREEKALREQERNAHAWKTKNKIEYYKKLIKLEELNIAKNKLKKRKASIAERISKVKLDAKSLKYDIPDTAFINRKSAQKELELFFDHATSLRWKEDIGSGLFFHKEKFYNGDYNWRFCGFLAGGEKNGTKESIHILHLLYRKRKDGNRQESIIFPFISHVQEGNNERTSFLWRIFSFEKNGKKTGGYIFFIPFGERSK